MENIQEQLERIIDEIEGDSEITKDEILSALNKLKTEMEDYQLSRDSGGDLQWEDLE